jgi:hypothetical protein
MTTALPSYTTSRDVTIPRNGNLLPLYGNLRPA